MTKRRKRKRKKNTGAYTCITCGKRFETQDSLYQHSQDTHTREERSVGAEVLAEVGEDMPDGAFFQMAQDFGIEPKDF